MFSMFILNQSLFANEQLELKNHLLNKISDVVKIVEDKSLTKDQRNLKITQTVTPMFDFELMTKLSLGKRAWINLSKKDRKEFTRLYVKRMQHSYSSKLDAYNGEKIKVQKIEQPKKNRIYFVTDLVSSDGKFEVIYKFYKSRKQKEDKDRWLIFDVEISGVSILKADQAQFREFLRTKSIYDLMKSFNK